MKIYDNERLEPPHVTIVKGRDSWRINLRTKAFMDEEPPPKDEPPPPDAKPAAPAASGTAPAGPAASAPATN